MESGDRPSIAAFGCAGSLPPDVPRAGHPSILHRTARLGSDFGLFRDLQGVVYLDAEVAHSGLEPMYLCP